MRSSVCVWVTAKGGGEQSVEMREREGGPPQSEMKQKICHYVILILPGIQRALSLADRYVKRVIIRAKRLRHTGSRHCGLRINSCTDGHRQLHAKENKAFLGP